MRKNTKTGVLVVGHGSRREEANEDVRNAVKAIGERGRFSNVDAAFLEIAAPNIGEGYARLVERGAGRIIIHPYFLSPGRHTRGDIPVKVAEAAANFPDVEYLITEPLAAHKLVIAASIDRISETADRDRIFSDENDGNAGTVYLVGAGPGDPGLLTVRASEMLRSCDAVLYDNLVNPLILDLVPSAAERIYVGKIGHGPQISQEKINRMLAERARRGQRVVRLKGGDPFIYGRGGEEAIALRNAGISFEIVPGISSALAVPAYAGIPLTHRGLADSVTILTGTGRRELEVDRDLARPADTIVILMGVSDLRNIARDLIDSGRNADTPAAVISNGTREAQQTVVGTLRTIADDVLRAGLKPPAVIVVGNVVDLRRRLNWFEPEISSEHIAEITHASAAAAI